MKQFFIILFIFIILLLPNNAAAQTDQVDHGGSLMSNNGDFFGTLQINPEKPISQQQATLMFTTSDSTHKFRIDNCDCVVTISAPGRLPYTQKITTPSATINGLYSVMVPFTFPRGGTYEITFTGNPITQNSFREFTLHWQLPVTATTNELQTLKSSKSSLRTNMVLLPLAVFVFLIALGFFVFKRKFK